MSAAVPEGKTFVKVTSERGGYPRDGSTYPPGSVLLLDEAAAEYACDEASPPFCERIPDEEAAERDLPERYGLVEPGPEPEPEPPEPGSPEAPYRFSPPARNLIQEAGLSISEYDGPASGEGRGDVTEEDAREWLKGRERPPPTDGAQEVIDEHDLDASEIDGTGKGGRVTKPDAEAAVEEEDEPGEA